MSGNAPGSFASARSLMWALAMTTLLTGLNACSTIHLPPTGVSEDRSLIKQFPVSESGGIKVAVKDLIDMKGEVTTAGSQFLAFTSKPATEDAQCLRIIRERRDVQIVGKANTTEFAISVSGVNPYFGTPKNPMSRLLPLIPGGSSSGSASAVANGTADVAIGTDTAGSIRVPAACCGVVGLKTTFGLISTKGVFPIAADHLDTVGSLGKDVAHTVIGMDLLVEGFAAKYRQTVANSPAPGKIRVGRLRVPGVNRDINRAVDDALQAAGFEVVDLPPELVREWKQADRSAQIIATSSSFKNNNRFQLDPGVALKTKLVIALGTVEYTTAYKKAVEIKPKWQATLNRVFQDIDFIALPTMKTLPPPIPFFRGTVAFEGYVLGLQNTAAANIAGVPAIAVPVPIDSYVPATSLQLVGPKYSEAKLLNAARIVEDATRDAMAKARD